MDNFPARGDYVKLGKGAFFVDAWENGAPSGRHKFLGNVTSGTLGANVDTAQLFSSTQASSALVDRRNIRTSYTLTLSCNEATMKNLELFLLGTNAESVQSAASDNERSFTNVQAGDYLDLQKRQVSAVQVYRQGNSTPLTVDVDYELQTEHGIVHILEGGEVVDDDEIIVNFTTTGVTLNTLAIANAASKTVALLFLGDDSNNDGKAAKDKLVVWKASVVPDGDLGLISDDYGSFNLAFALLSDSSHSTQPYGYLERVGSSL